MANNYRSQVLIVVLLSFFAFLQYRLWLGPAGIQDMRRLKKTLAMHIKENERLKQSNQELLFQVQRLQNSNDAVEVRARNELGMVKKDEQFYQIVK